MSAAGIFARRAACLRNSCTSALTRNCTPQVRLDALLKNQPQFAILLQRYYASKSFPPHSVITMPALSPTMTAGNIGTWHKNLGDKVTAGDVLVEIETDKAQMDFEFQEDDGILAKILAQTGEKDVAVGNPIAVLVEKNVDISAFSDFTIEDAGGAKKPPPLPKEEALDSSEPAKEESKSAPAPEAKESESSGKPIETVLDRDRIYASPLAKKIALEQGVPLKNVKGTGDHGRITKVDVENYLKTVSGATIPGATPGATYTDTPLSAMRKTIATRLTASKNTSPHYYVQSTVNASKLLKLRAALNASAAGKYKLSVNDFLIKAAAAALQKVPAVNSSYLEAEGVLRQHNVVDISVAVATPVGLMTPIVKSAHARGLQSISAEVKALAARAQESKLKPEEYQGGTFTISNMGMNPAIERFTAIINPPQAAILAVGTVKKVPVETEDGGVAWEEQIVLSTSFDHRAIDGAVGAEFMGELKKIIENPLELLL